MYGLAGCTRVEMCWGVLADLRLIDWQHYARVPHMPRRPQEIQVLEEEEAVWVDAGVMTSKLLR